MSHPASPLTVTVRPSEGPTDLELFGTAWVNHSICLTPALASLSIAQPNHHYVIMTPILYTNTSSIVWP
jgi:hypothetical protein